MRRGMIIAFTVLGLAACGQKENTGATGAASSGGTAPEGAASPAVSAPAATAGEESPETKGCLDLVATERYSDAVPACQKALGADATNEQVKAALATAQAKVAEMAAGAAQGAADEAKDAADAAEDAAGAAKDAMPAPKTY